MIAAPHEAQRAGLPARVKDHLARKTQWLEQTLGDFESVEDKLGGPRLDELERLDAANARSVARFQVEYEQLREEWQAASDVSQADRVEVRRLSERADELAALLCQAYESAINAIAERNASVKHELNQLGRGRGLLCKYRFGQHADAAFIDKKA